jgi:rhodanese-related sulfurtransferase
VTAARVGAIEAARLMREEGYSYLDVRRVDEFAQGHPEGAYNIPWQVRGAQGAMPNPDFLGAVHAAFGRDHKLVVGCHAGPRSRAAAAALIADGYRDVVEQSAGFAGARDAFGRTTEPGWRAAGLPCAETALPGRDYASLARKPND